MIQEDDRQLVVTLIKDPNAGRGKHGIGNALQA
jgi:hypothetical protein